MKQIGIKLADGSFYPILEDGKPAGKKLGLTTVMDNQSRVVVDLYRSDTDTMEDAEYIDSLQINNLVAHPKVSVDIPLKITLDENNRLSAVLIDPETGATSNANITLVSRTLEERLEPMNYDVKMEDNDFDIPETADLKNENISEKPAEKTTAPSIKAAGAVAAVAAGGGLLAKVMAKQNEKSGTASEENSERLSEAMANKADALKDISEKAEYEIPTINTEKDSPENPFDLSSLKNEDGEKMPSDEPIENIEDNFSIKSDGTGNAAEDNSSFDDMLTDFSDSTATELPSFDDSLNLPVEGENSADDFSGIPENSAIDAEKDSPENPFDLSSLKNEDSEKMPSDEPLENMEDKFSTESDGTENAAEDNSSFDDMLPDFSDSADTELPSFDDSLNLPEDGENSADGISDITEESTIDAEKDSTSNSAQDTSFDDALDFDLPDFGESSAESSESDNPFSSLDSFDAADKTLESDSALDVPSEENENAPAASNADDPFSLPDFGESKNADATDTSDELNELDLPNFPEIENSKADDFSELDLPDFPETESSKADDFSEFDLPDFPKEENLNMNDDDFMTTARATDDDPFAFSSETTMAETGSALDFDGLYDKETVEGTSYSEGTRTAEEIRKKTKIPVIICLVCAVICIIAVVFMLLVVPSKYNLLGKRKADSGEQVIAEQKITEPIPSPAPESMPEPKPLPETQAKEDEIVIVTEPEIVETVEPEKPSEPEKPKVITYKIKWGDTLWDISNAYYKNPWRYRMIARYNNIKNPDYIISGTTIQIPQE